MKTSRLVSLIYLDTILTMDLEVREMFVLKDEKCFTIDNALRIVYECIRHI